MSREPTDESTQKTRPKKGEPVEIPIPLKDQIEREFTKIAMSRLASDEDENAN